MIHQPMDVSHALSLEDERIRRHRRILFGVIAIVFLTIIAYIPAYGAGFIWDDESYVQNNRLLHDLEGLRYIWLPESPDPGLNRPPRRTPQYYPVVFTTFWLEYQLWQLEPRGYHVFNVLLHILNALLLWVVCRRIGLPGPVAWLVAALFAVHPVHVESVAWITERKNVLSGFFYLSAALAYFRFQSIRDGEIQHKPPKEAWGWYGLALALFVFALLSKSVTCSLPAALILVMLWKRHPINVRALLPLVPMFILGVVAALNTAIIEREHVGAQGIEFAFTLPEKMLIASKALLFYPLKILWPRPLMFNYPRWEIDASDILSWWSVLLVIGIGIALLVLYRKGRRGPFLALSFYAGTVFPAIGFFSVYPHQFSFVADHFQYLASIGLLILIATGLHCFISLPKRYLTVMSIPLIVFAGMSQYQCGDYQNLETLWRNTLAKNPEAWMPHNNLSSILLKQAETSRQLGENADELIESARTHAQRAVDIKPGHHTAHSNLSEALRLQGRLDEALRQSRVAVQAKPKWPDHHRNLGRLHELMNRPDLAKSAYQKTLELNPAYVSVRLDYARLLLQEGNLEAAARQYSRVLEHQPGHYMALGTLANISVQLKRHTEADTLYQRAFEAVPATQVAEKIQIAMRHAIFLMQCPDSQVRNPLKAIFIAEQIVRATNRSLPNTLDVLAMANAAAGRFENAVAIAREAAALARSMGLTDMATEYESRLEAYRRNELPALAQPEPD